MRATQLRYWHTGMLCALIGGFALSACGGEDAEPTGVIYVAPAGDDSAPGTARATPLASIPVAIERALGCEPEPCVVHLSGGDFVGSVTLAGGVDLRGGYSDDFRERDIETHTTLIIGDALRALIADNLSESVTLDGVHVRGVDYPDDKSGQSSIGLWVRASGEFLQILNGTISGGDAADGADGAPGEERACAALGGSGGEAYDCGSNPGMVGAADGDPEAEGSGGGGGGSNCPNACPLVGDDGISDGQPGLDGAAGVDGTSGLSAVDNDGAFVAGAWVGARGTGGERGTNGTGGGGGGSGGSKRFRACFGCGTLLGGRGGDGGAGGCGGTGGQPGEPGGGSFGAVIIDSVVSLHEVSVGGGRGGRGGRGGDGGPGTPGGSDGTIGQQGRGGQQCGLINYSSGAGGVGGIGGDGGHGGGGAGGGGGPSVGLVLVGAGGYYVGGSLTVLPGESGRGGFGGYGGMANGEDGLRGSDEPELSYP